MLEINKTYNYNCLEGLKLLDDSTVDCCVTSPPYWGLRDYGTAIWMGGEPNCTHQRDNKINTSPNQYTAASGDMIYKDTCLKCGAIREDEQIGLEKTPEEYVNTMVKIFGEVKRVLKPQGTLWLNLGDSYAGSGGAGSKEYAETKHTEFGKPYNIEKYQPPKNTKIVNKAKDRSTDKWSYSNCPAEGILKPKDLVGIPWMTAFALRADGWWLRQDIIWHKRNPMPESVTDRCTKSHEYIFLLSKSQKYYFDYEAIQEEATGYDGRKDTLMKGSDKYADGEYLQMGNANSLSIVGRERWKYKKGRKFGGNKYGDNDDPKFQIYSGNEYQPKYKNLQDKGQTPHTMHENRVNGNDDKLYPIRNKRDVWTVNTKPYKEAHFAVYPEELIVDCIKAGCPPNGIVLDPFMGSGTTGVVARKLDRNFIGFELNSKYITISEKRLYNELGMFL